MCFSMWQGLLTEPPDAALLATGGADPLSPQVLVCFVVKGTTWGRRRGGGGTEPCGAALLWVLVRDATLLVLSGLFCCAGWGGEAAWSHFMVLATLCDERNHVSFGSCCSTEAFRTHSA